MRRKLEDEFVLMQIWITDRKIGDLADRQWDRMGEQFGTNSIPLHAIVSPEGKELARLDYRPNLVEADYLAFLDRGLAAMRK